DIPSNATWTDNIYINSIPTFNRYTWLGQSVNRQGPLASQASYTVSRTISLGAGYPAGSSYNWVETDVHGTINEYGYEDPNHDGASHTVISYPAQDIEASNLVAPASGQSGQNVNVSWTVQNISAYSTVSTFWTDALYLSVDPVLSPATDTRVATVDRTGGLAAGASYSRNISVMLPNGLAGEFYWIVKTDSANTVNDSNPVNNSFTRATPIEITLTIPPDLITSALAGESQITAGQPLSLLFDVINQGAGAATTPTWYDALYLSTNVTVDPSDVRLTTLTHSGSLSPSSSYAVNGSCDIPTYAGGNYYVLAKADNRDDVYEALNEGNNTTPHALFVTVPPPSDLTVSGALFPDTAGVGDVITVSYTLSNSSGNPAVGWMRDGVYFSLDSIWDVNDPLLAYNDHHVNILSGATLVIEKDLNLDRTLALKDVCVQTGSRGLDEGENGSVADEMPGVVPGDYHIIVRTDLRDNIREDDNLNNALLTPGTIHVDLPELTLSVPDTRSFTAGKERFYKVNVGAGLDLRITLISDRADAANEAYVSYGSVPSLSNFEFNGSEPFSSGQQFFVPSTQAGTYYLMVHARTVPTTPENLTLLVEALPFSILSVSPDHVGQGRVTTTITGAGFRDWTQAFIRLADNTLHEAIKVNITNSTRTDFTWELASVPLGTYNVILKNSPADSVESINALTIEPAQGLTYEIMDSSPSSFRATGVANLTICIQNITNVDLPYFWATVFTPGWSRVLGVQCDERFLRFQLPLPDMLDQRYLSWSIRKDGDKHNYTYVLARDIAPGEILCMSIVLAGFPSYALPVSISSEAQSEEDFIADMSRKVDNTRERILAGLLEVIPDFELLAQNAEDFQDSLFEDFEDSGVLDTPTPRPAPGPGEEFVDPPSDPQPCDTIPCEISPCDANICPPDPPFIPPGCNRPAELPNTCNPDLCQQREESICEGVRGVVQKGSKAGLAMGAIVGMYCQIGGYWTCRFLHKNIEEICKTIFVSCDPNDIVGPEGYGDERWIGKSELMPYTIHFENDDSLATAHANTVHITQQLDSDLNPNSFRLGSFGFGSMTFTVPENRAFYSTRLDVRDSLGIYVDVVAGIVVQTNEVFWHFESVDPATGQAPNDPFMGFLAINDSTHRGEGFVNYTITPRNTVETGDVIDAEASIVFDVNDPVETPPIFNTIDADAPVSSVSPLPFQPPDVTFDVNFSGADFVPGSGLASYSIYVSEDRGPFNLFAGSLTDTTVSFTGVPGHMYEYFSLATDYAGNLEPMKSVAEATTFLQVSQLDTVQDLTIRCLQTNDSVQTTLRWTGLPGNVRYYAYTSTSAPEWNDGTDWSLIGSTTGTSMQDLRQTAAAGEKRFYLILAYVIP
ncbi:hypothetical protein IT157_07245, partial [bacterium]|nr:hypothetical protein [bacterium]